MKKLIVGNFAILGIECIVNNFQNLEGKLFLHVADVKFGQGEFDEDLLELIDRLQPVQIPQKNYDNLFKLDGRELLQSFKVAQEGLGNVPEVFSELNFYDVDSDIIIRAGYAFDGHFIALVCNLHYEKLIIQYEPDHKYAEIVLTRGSFYGLLNELKIKLKSHLQCV